MKGNKIDDLFRKGLASHKISAPSNAWEKIETQLPSQSKKGIYFWLSIAASLALVFTFGWIMINNSNSVEVINKNLSAENSTLEKKDDSAVQKSPQAPELKVDTPAALDTKALVAEVTPDKNKQEEEAIITNAPNAFITTQIVNLNAQVEAKNLEVVAIEFKEIELIKIDRRFAPKFQIVESIAQNNFMIDISIDVEAYINSHQTIISELPGKRKRFSLLSGIANVARGVNNGKIALSEIRKSKNDFVNNDLKYGSKESEDEDEDLEDDLEKQEDNLNKK